MITWHPDAAPQPGDEYADIIMAGLRALGDALLGLCLVAALAACLTTLVVRAVCP